jgi:NAD-dependent dihydropyrimidine dehydrogenase PreA subunit
MPHVIAEPRIGVKATTCVNSCPVDCIQSTQGGNQVSKNRNNRLSIPPNASIRVRAFPYVAHLFGRT